MIGGTAQQCCRLRESIAVMNNLLNLMGVPPFLREAFKGFIVIAAVLLQKKEAAA